MLTPDQIRERLDEAVKMQDRASPVLYLLYDVLPDLVALVQPAQRPESQEREHFYVRGYDGPRQCPDCTSEQSCERALTLTNDAYRQHRRDCTAGCYKTLRCPEALRLAHG